MTAGNNRTPERLAASDPANAEWRHDLWVSCWRLADLSEKSRQAADARTWWRKACDTLAGMKQRGLHVSPEDQGFLERLRAKAGGKLKGDRKISARCPARQKPAVPRESALERCFSAAFSARTTRDKVAASDRDNSARALPILTAVAPNEPVSRQSAKSAPESRIRSPETPPRMPVATLSSAMSPS